MSQLKSETRKHVGLLEWSMMGFLVYFRVNVIKKEELKMEEHRKEGGSHSLKECTWKGRYRSTPYGDIRLQNILIHCHYSLIEHLHCSKYSSKLS